jgi:flagellum-specific ATP synthase
MWSAGQLARAAAISAATPRVQACGRVVRLTGMLIEAHAPNARIGAIVEMSKGHDSVLGEIVGFRGDLSLIVPLADTKGLAPGAAVRPTEHAAEVPVAEAMLGRVLDPFGRPLDGGPGFEAEAVVPLERPAPAIGVRRRISERFETGVRAIDVLLPCGRGQRVGLFAGAGVGKTVLIRQIARQSAADVTVIGLVGERGGEVRDLLETELGPRAVVIVATSDRTAMERVRGAHAAVAVAEHFRDQGKHVLLVLDSLTRYAMALREIGLAAGEPPATKGYPPSVFAAMPRLLERAAPLAGAGSITGFFTVLMEGDDLSDPVADSARSLLDGHIVLSRSLAARGHFPAIDVLSSASRVAHAVATKEALAVATKARSILALEKDTQELKSMGAYVPGQSPAADQALELGGRIGEWARQASDDQTTSDEAMARLTTLLAKPVAPVRGGAK